MSKQKAQDIDQGYWSTVWRQFQKNRLAVWSLRILYVIFFVGTFSSFLANEKPVYCKLNGKTYFPIFLELGVNMGISKMPPELLNIDWINASYESVLRAPIPYSPLTQNWDNPYDSPVKKQDVKSWRFRHFLGTDQLGRDLLAGLIHGTGIAMEVGIISMAIASLIGIFLGAIAGYFGDERLQLSRISLLLNALFLFFAWFYAFNIRMYILSDALSESFLTFGLQF